MFRSLLLVCLGVVAVAQDRPSTNTNVSENGAVNVYADGGWSFGLPAVRAAVVVPGLGSAISPERKTLAAPDFGLTVTAWKFLVPFVDFTSFDTGKATATVGPFTSQGQASTFAFNSGLRFVAGKSRVRGYAEFGGGLVHQNLKASLSAAGSTTSDSGSSSLGDFMYGGGMQFFAGRRWGSDLGFDAFHLGQPMNGAGQNFSRIRIGLFFQTKSAVK